ncbi:Uu.00g102400.m01.CDS01 [Anthostomella pinea]|uniref:Uu.00g102400.m01.CDS01 n=1 Tax=Anthostomella pinea TaxID=933095 RepID=A0AAI8YFH7_9PEZI|nr:Uu.00g102400.m01.CDS01 [Anthostomella pinea]
MTKRSTTVMMRIAIAGAGGFAALLTQELSQSANPVIVLSTKAHPDFETNYNCQVAVVDYHNIENLQFILQGVDLVLSTISGAEQLNLIDAARRARVRCFVPSEFEGSLSHRPTSHDPFDNDSSTALEQLRHWSSSRHFPMKSTVFSCGIFYERFAPGGLQAYNMGITCRLPHQGDYMINVGLGTAEIPATNVQGRQIQVVMTSAVDVARFVAAAVDLGIDTWPHEFKMRGARVTPQRIQQLCSEVRQVEFAVITRPYPELLSWLQYYEQNHDEARWYSMQHMIQTANGRFSFSDANLLNDLVDVEPMGFRQWLYNNWGPAQ